MNNKNLISAQKADKDEFYTRYTDIESELTNYPSSYFTDKTIYCNCDSNTSNFFRYFCNNFSRLHLNKLIATGIHSDKAYIYNGSEIKTETILDGHYDSDCLSDYINQADIVVTNPPFSQFSAYINFLLSKQKKFIIWGNLNAVTYTDIFPKFVSGLISVGYTINATEYFAVPDGYYYNTAATDKIADGKHYARVPNITTFTNLPVNQTTPLKLSKSFSKSDYPMFDNYPAFNVAKTADIPADETIQLTIATDRLSEFQQVYKSDLSVINSDTSMNPFNNLIEVQIKHPIFAVPITYLSKSRNNVYRIIGQANHQSAKDKYDLFVPYLNGKQKFKKLLIRHV